jgi:transposase
MIEVQVGGRLLAVGDGRPAVAASAAVCWLSEGQRLRGGDDVRVTTAFNKMLALQGAWVRDVAFDAEGVIVTVALTAKTPVCSGCGARGLGIKEHRTKRWRHLDLGGSKWFIESLLRRLYCPSCGDVYERVPWARAGSPYTRDFEDLTAFLAQQMKPDRGLAADADRVAHGRQDSCACRRRQARPRPPGRASADRRG